VLGGVHPEERHDSQHGIESANPIGVANRAGDASSAELSFAPWPALADAGNDAGSANITAILDRNGQRKDGHPP
jgi:hypothetical protein